MALEQLISEAKEKMPKLHYPQLDYNLKLIAKGANEDTAKKLVDVATSRRQGGLPYPERDIAIIADNTGDAGHTEAAIDIIDRRFYRKHWPTATALTGALSTLGQLKQGKGFDNALSVLGRWKFRRMISKYYDIDKLAAETFLDEGNQGNETTYLKRMLTAVTLTAATNPELGEALVDLFNSRTCLDRAYLIDPISSAMSHIGFTDEGDDIQACRMMNILESDDFKRVADLTYDYKPSLMPDLVSCLEGVSHGAGHLAYRLTAVLDYHMNRDFRGNGIQDSVKTSLRLVSSLNKFMSRANPDDVEDIVDLVTDEFYLQSLATTVNMVSTISNLFDRKLKTEAGSAVNASRIAIETYAGDDFKELLTRWNQRVSHRMLTSVADIAYETQDAGEVQKLLDIYGSSAFTRLVQYFDEDKEWVPEQAGDICGQFAELVSKFVSPEEKDRVAASKSLLAVTYGAYFHHRSEVYTFRTFEEFTDLEKIFDEAVLPLAYVGVLDALQHGFEKQVYREFAGYLAENVDKAEEFSKYVFQDRGYVRKQSSQDVLPMAAMLYEVGAEYEGMLKGAEDSTRRSLINAFGYARNAGPDEDGTSGLEMFYSALKQTLAEYPDSLGEWAERLVQDFESGTGEGLLRAA